jgi:hypothetical protein
MTAALDPHGVGGSAMRRSVVNCLDLPDAACGFRIVPPIPARAECAAIATTRSVPVEEAASSERTAVMTILFPVHRFGYAVKM